MASNTGSATNRRDSHVNSMELKKYLEGVSFPADKTKLVEHAKQQQAPSQIIDLLQQLQTPEFGSPNAAKLTEYNSMDELVREVEKIE